MLHVAHKFYWVMPLFASLLWLGMLLGMLLYWIIDTHSEQYISLDPGQHIAYISDVGASALKPLFIAGSTVTVVLLDAALIAERWLRHEGRLAPNTTWFQRSMSILSILAGIAGAIGLILLSIFDTARYPKMHDRCLAVFIVGYVLSAIFICTEYQRLGAKYRQHITLRVSFWYKLLFIILEIALAIPFGVFEATDKHVNAGAVLEWVIALVFTGYIFSFVVDLIPALRNHHLQSHYTNRRSVAGVHGEEKYTSDEEYNARYTPDAGEGHVREYRH